MSEWTIEERDAEIRRLSAAQEEALRASPEEQAARQRERAWLIGWAVVQADEVSIVLAQLPRVLEALAQIAQQGAAGENDRMWLFRRDWLESDHHTVDEDHPSL